MRAKSGESSVRFASDYAKRISQDPSACEIAPTCVIEKSTSACGSSSPHKPNRPAVRIVGVYRRFRCLNH